MKIEVYLKKDEYGSDERFELAVNGRYQFSIGNGLSECPEDAILGRDLNFVFSIPNLMKQAYEAGKNGEEFDIEWLDEEENK